MSEDMHESRITSASSECRQPPAPLMLGIMLGHHRYNSTNHYSCKVSQRNELRHDTMMVDAL